ALARLFRISVSGSQCRCVAGGIRRGAFRLLRPHFERPTATARTLETCGRGTQRWAGRGDGPVVRAEVFSTRGQTEGCGTRGESAARVFSSHSTAPLDVC